MYNGVGVPTPRGTGTNGYVQRNFAALPRIKKKPSDFERERREPAPTEPRKPDTEILEHDKKRQIEVKLMAWAEEQGLLDANLPKEKLDALLNEARERIIQEEAERAELRAMLQKKREEETHKKLAAKERQRAELQEAWKIDKDYQEGQAFNRTLQQQKKLERLEQRMKEEEERKEKEKQREKERRKQEKERRRQEEEDANTEKQDKNNNERKRKRDEVEKKNVEKESEKNNEGDKHDSKRARQNTETQTDTNSPHKRKSRSISRSRSRSRSRSNSSSTSRSNSSSRSRSRSRSKSRGRKERR